jgi:hypothetical protein
MSDVFLNPLLDSNVPAMLEVEGFPAAAEVKRSRLLVL